MENRSLLIGVVGLSAFLFLILFLNLFFVPKITRDVIQELKREYTPGPYDPAYDPDKINPNLLRSEVSETQIESN
jgi:hypothetical protein